MPDPIPFPVKQEKLEPRVYHVGNTYGRGGSPGSFQQKTELRRRPKYPGYYQYTPPVKTFTKAELMATMKKVRSHSVTIGIVGYLKPEEQYHPEDYDGGRTFLGRIKGTLYAYDVIEHWPKGADDVRDALSDLTGFQWLVIEAVYLTERRPLQTNPVLARR